MQTNLDGVFAAGDIVRGAFSLFGHKRWKRCRFQIEKYLKSKDSKNKSVKAAYQNEELSK